LSAQAKGKKGSSTDILRKETLNKAKSRQCISISNLEANPKEELKALEKRVGRPVAEGVRSDHEKVANSESMQGEERLVARQGEGMSSHKAWGRMHFMQSSSGGKAFSVQQNGNEGASKAKAL